jgi:hypothetical protein
MQIISEADIHIPDLTNGFEHPCQTGSLYSVHVHRFVIERAARIEYVK